MLDLDLYGEVNKEVSWLWLVVSLLMISCGEIVVVNCCGKTPIEGTSSGNGKRSGISG